MISAVVASMESLKGMTGQLAALTVEVHQRLSLLMICLQTVKHGSGWSSLRMTSLPPQQSHTPSTLLFLLTMW